MSAQQVNRPIIRLYGLVVLLFALLIAFTSRWTIFEASSLRDNALNKRAVLEQQHIDRGPIVAADGTVLAHSLRRAEGDLRTQLPDREPVREHHRLLLHEPRQHGRRALPLERAQRPDRHRRPVDPRPAAGPQTARAEGRDLAGPEGAARRRRGARRTPGRRRRAGTAQRRGHRDGLLAQLQPEPAQNERRLRAARPRQLRAADQPRHPVRLRARLDLQGRDRDGGDRQREVHAGIDGLGT